jgi:hypothetical protein
VQVEANPREGSVGQADLNRIGSKIAQNADGQILALRSILSEGLDRTGCGDYQECVPRDLCLEVYRQALSAARSGVKGEVEVGVPSRCEVKQVQTKLQLRGQGAGVDGNQILARGWSAFQPSGFIDVAQVHIYPGSEGAGSGLGQAGGEQEQEDQESGGAVRHSYYLTI